MNINKKALDFFEKNEYEEEDDEKTLELIKEVIHMNPLSYFPYNLLGKIYSKQKKWQLASDAFLKSRSIQPSNEAYHNLAIARYRLRDVREASDYFLRVAGNSDSAMYSHVKCLIELGKKTEAREKLDAFMVEADEFVGEIEIADLYVELDCFKEAIYWFEKGWNDYWKDPYWISRFIYSLFHTRNITRIYEVVNEAIKQKDEEIKNAHEEECEENWTKNDKEAHITQLLEEKNKYENMVELISSGHIPLIEFETSITGACYLFGCKRHNHPEYQE